MTKVKQWAPHADGRRTAFFDARPGVLVKVEPEAGGSSDAALAVARELADHASALARRDEKIERLTKQVELLSRELRVVNGRVPPPAPVRLLGTGYVRFAEDGRPWLLSRREGGWAEVGVRCESWDDLFRRYDVRVVEHGVDEHSAWWAVKNGEP